MKFKPLTKNQIIISIDRLTRFKPTEEKYLRVFKDIIISNLIEPKFKKQDLENLDYITLRNLAVEIFNGSLKENNTDNLILNQKLKKYENSVFINNEFVNVLLDNDLDYISALKLLEKPIPINLRWLKEMMSDVDMYRLREEKTLQYPVSLVVLVEGITEEILLPAFSKVLGFDFLKYGIKIIPAGGKNQVVKLYYSLSEELKLPIFVLLDKDAVENVNLINKKLRKDDKAYLLNSGEFEDLLPLNLILKTINSHLKNFATITLSDLESEGPMVKVLEDIFKRCGIHEFKKSEFAHLLQSQIKTEADISNEIRSIITSLKEMSEKHDKSLI